MYSKFKFRHLNTISQKQIDYATLMQELDGYKNKRWRRRKRFKESFTRTHAFIEQIKNLKPKTVRINPDSKIHVPKSLDDITFQSMMEIQTLTNTPGDKTTPDIMLDLVALACYSANYNGDFDSDGYLYKQFRHSLSESPALDVIGLYNHIEGLMKASESFWNARFLDVQVIDQDYLEAGGERMSAFNVLNTIKALCFDFNITDKEAWQKPYGITQANSLSKATQGHIQHKMSQIKERKMRLAQQVRR